MRERVPSAARRGRASAARKPPPRPRAARRGPPLPPFRRCANAAGLCRAALRPDLIGLCVVRLPDPWHKRRHHKRRLIAPATLDLLASVMEDRAELRLAPDDRGYLAWMLEHLTAHPDFHWLARRPADWRERPPHWPATRYEEKARAPGRRPAFLPFQRRPRA